MKRPSRSHPPIRSRLKKHDSGSLKSAVVEALQQDRSIEHKKLGFLRRGAKRLRESWFVVGLEALGLISLIFAVGLFVYEARERQDERAARSWQLLTTPAPGNSGKTAALEYLNSEFLCFSGKYAIPLIGRCWKESVPLIGIDLSSSPGEAPVYLQSLNLAGADLRDAKLSRANLRNAILSNVEFSKADLSGANLSDADLSGADLYDIDLTGTNLSGANLSNANLSKVTLSETTIFDGSSLSGALLLEVDLTNINLMRVNLTGVEFQKPKMTGANFFEANLAELDMSGFDLSSTILHVTNLTGVDLSGADLSDADLSETNLSNANLRDIKLSAKTNLQYIWAWEGMTPRNTPAEILKMLYYRMPGENCDDFMDRITVHEGDGGDGGDRYCAGDK